MAMLTNAKVLARDGISIIRQTLGLPHNKTRAQFWALMATFNEETLAPLRIKLIAVAARLSEAQVEGYMNEWKDTDFTQRARATDRRLPSGTNESDQLTLYALVRCFSPHLIVETGVAAGTTSVVFLKQIARQGEGTLHSIDIDTPAAANYGELIPQELRKNWELHIQHSTPLLPVLLKELKQIDFFLHDSRHTYGHMQWEYETAWPYLRGGGCLASHDVLMLTAFGTFCGAYQGEIAASGIVGNVGFCIKR